MRFIKDDKVVYIRKEDVIIYLLNMAITESHNETSHDASLRLKEAARLLGGIGA
jgi:hypothetical protein